MTIPQGGLKRQLSTFRGKRPPSESQNFNRRPKNINRTKTSVASLDPTSLTAESTNPNCQKKAGVMKFAKIEETGEGHVEVKETGYP